MNPVTMAAVTVISFAIAASIILLVVYGTDWLVSRREKNR